MSELLQFALVTFTSVLFIVDPIAVIPTYLVITQDESPAQRAITVRRACVAAALILVVFTLAGRLIFQLLGITFPAFRIAGGLILWLVAMDMLHGVRTTQESAPEISEGRVKEDVAITPLAMPMLAGQAGTPARLVVIYASIVVTMLVAWLTLRVGDRLVTRLGQTGIRVMTRLMGLLLAAIAVQFVVTGVKDALAS